MALPRFDMQQLPSSRLFILIEKKQNTRVVKGNNASEENVEIY